ASSPLSLHDALPICHAGADRRDRGGGLSALRAGQKLHGYGAAEHGGGAREAGAAAPSNAADERGGEEDRAGGARPGDATRDNAIVRFAATRAGVAARTAGAFHVRPRL